MRSNEKRRPIYRFEPARSIAIGKLHLVFVLRACRLAEHDEFCFLAVHAILRGASGRKLRRDGKMSRYDLEKGRAPAREMSILF
jgi:hypothetical protein